MKAGEIIRIIVFSLVGAVFMFLVQPWFYQSGSIDINISRIEAWVSNYYTTAALIVFGVSVFSTIVWCVSTARSKDSRANEIAKWSLIWWLIGLLPVFSIGIAIGLYRGSDEAFLSLIVFFILDFLWLYWFTTATSTPGLFMFIPPLAYRVRGLIGAR